MAKTIRARHPKPKQVQNNQAMSAEIPPANSDLLNALETMSARELTTVIEKASSIHAAKMDGEKQEFFDRVRAEAAELGISLDQIIPSAPAHRRMKSNAKSQAPVRFRGPNQNDTWTGRGRLPNWLAALEAEGRSRAEFLVEKPI